METCPLHQAKLEVGDLVRLCLGESHFAVGYLKYPVRNHWLSPGNLGLILSRTDPYRNRNIRDHLQGAVSRTLGRFSDGVLSLYVSKNSEVSILQSAAEGPSREKLRDFPLTGVDIGDIVLLSDKDLQVAGHVHEISQKHILLGYRFPEEAPIWLRRYDLSKFRNYESLRERLR